MGDKRFDGALDGLVGSPDAAKRLREMSDADVVRALAASSRTHEPYIANVLATEALNRLRRRRAIAAAFIVAGTVIIASRTAYLLWMSTREEDPLAILLFTVGSLAVGAAAGLVAFRIARHP